MVSRTESEVAAARYSPPSLDALFRAHADDVYRFVARQLGPGADAAMIEDLTQEVFISAGRALPGFRGESKVSTWLYTIAGRAVLNHLESGRRHRRLMANLEASIAAAPVQVASSETRLGNVQELRIAWRCLMRIKPKKRIVFVLFQIEGKSGAEIAEILGIKEATVWTRLHHARRELMDCAARCGREHQR